jgi:mannose-6-phosphate isomerase-like protein (cupin superfamily)
MLLQHRITGWAGPFSIGVSHMLPGAGIEIEASPAFTVYVVVAGRLEIPLAGGIEMLGPLDSVAAQPGELVSIRNPENAVATLLVAEAVPAG